MRASMWSKTYGNRRMAVLLGLGFAAGLPSSYRLLGSTLQAWLIDAGYDLQTIGLFALVSLPFALNFVWAPLLDRYAPQWFGMDRRRSWLIPIQAMLIITIALMGWLGPTDAAHSLWPLTLAGLMVAFFAATQDVLVDAYRTDVLPAAQRGAGAAVYVNGYRIGMLFAGGGALLLSDYLSWSQVYFIMAGCMVPGLIATWFAPPPLQDKPPRSLAEAVGQPMLSMARRDGWVMLGVLLFIILFKLPDAMANAMTMPLLQGGLGWEKSQIAWVREWGGLLAIMTGAMTGGWIIARWSLRRSLWLFGSLQILSNFGLLLLAVTEKNLGLFIGAMLVESFCAGLVAAGFIAFLMSRCDPRYSATQYALFTSLMYASGQLVGAGTGWLVVQMGYASFFALTMAMGIPGMMLLWLIGPYLQNNRTDETEMVDTDILTK